MKVFAVLATVLVVLATPNAKGDSDGKGGGDACGDDKKLDTSKDGDKKGEDKKDSIPLGQYAKGTVLPKYDVE